MKWQKVRDFEDIIYEKMDGIAKVTINRPHKRNAFTPDTVMEMIEAFTDAREDPSIGVADRCRSAYGWKICVLLGWRPGGSRKPERRLSG